MRFSTLPSVVTANSFLPSLSLIHRLRSRQKALSLPSGESAELNWRPRSRGPPPPALPRLPREGPSLSALASALGGSPALSVARSRSWFLPSSLHSSDLPSSSHLTVIEPDLSVPPIFLATSW